ncbi:CPBP family intramembrane metalloprotease [Bacillus sp. B190/17]|uniref:CPBP family intramembrane metalloprotease n=1 Tax=Bacillus lumedeiriae TaxID=3058829 RepID=A0ABW8I8H7_9BACI
MLEIGFWIIIIFTLLYEPVIGYFDFQRFKKNVRLKEDVRIKYYINTMVGLWIPTIFILLIIIFTDLTLKQVGVNMPAINTNVLGSAVTYVGFGIALLYFLIILYYAIGYHVSEKIRSQLTKAKEQELRNIEFSAILPISKKEKKLWNYVSFTAGVTEEIIYRGFLIFALAYLFPSVSIWAVILISSLLFGLAHTYQGAVKGVLRTAVVGCLFAILYIGLGSILPLIAFHFLIDYVVKLGDVDPINYNK